MLLNTDVNEWHRQTGASPKAVLRTLSGLQVVQGGCESVAPVSTAPPGRHAGTLPGPQKRKKPIR
ncbi:hypothetical protein FMJ40_04695, partial [Klebsiella variicola]|nr:hypothetical protein [Klebsiella variicola]MBZ6577094.1 hypothetical protein [Klebsiella variicola]MBZ7586179.1 hypothetical protein [Klebsiella variicola]MBZ7597653.1 hypothetical protein [Klebsiella variicola]